MAKKHEEHEEHADETWLVPYADVLTLLLALFIVLFAMSQVDTKKFEQIAESFRAALGTGSGVGSGLGILDGANSIEPRLAPTSAESRAASAQSAADEQAELQDLAAQLHAYIEENQLNTLVSTDITPEGLSITLQDALFFAPGSATVLPAAQALADKIAQMLAGINQRVIIAGHTDNSPIRTAEFPSNWDLSSKRAVNFMKYLIEREPSLRPERFSATGYGEYQPLVPNYTEEGREENRRVEVMIVRNYRPPEGAQLQR